MLDLKFIFFSFTDNTKSCFSINFVFKYLFIKNFIASDALIISELLPLIVIGFPLKNIFVLVNF